MAKFLKICKECGKPFETESNRRLFCYSDHYRTCTVCGERFFIPNDKLAGGRTTCSEKCRRKAISNSDVYKTPRFKCKCILCGKEFLSTSSGAKVCNGDHIAECVICGAHFHLSHQQAISGTSTCSKKCKYELIKRTNIEKYGVDTIFKSPEYQEKINKTMLSKYGVLNYQQSAQGRAALSSRWKDYERKVVKCKMIGKLK